MPCLDGPADDYPGGIHLLAVQACLDLIMLVFMISNNAFIIFCVMSSRRSNATSLSVARASSRFIVNLAAADAWVGLSTIYYLSFRYFCGAAEVLGTTKVTCLLRFVFMTSGHMASAYCLAAIAIDRYFAVVHALRYRELMNYRRSTVLIVACWVFSIVPTSSILYWNNWSKGIACEMETILPVYFVFLVGLLTHGTIMLVVCATHYRIHQEAQAVNQRRRSNESGRAICSSSDNVESSSGINTKSARTVLQVTGVYIFCWSPYTIIFLIRFFGYNTPALEVIFNFSHTFANINYLVNPFIYSWKNAAVKASILRTLRSLNVVKKPVLNNFSVRVNNNRMFPSASLSVDPL